MNLKKSKWPIFWNGLSTFICSWCPWRANWWKIDLKIIIYTWISDLDLLKCWRLITVCRSGAKSWMQIDRRKQITNTFSSRFVGFSQILLRICRLTSMHISDRKALYNCTSLFLSWKKKGHLFAGWLHRARYVEVMGDREIRINLKKDVAGRTVC